MKSVYDWHWGQCNHNWNMQRRTPRTAREAFGHSLDSGHRGADYWVLLSGLVCLAAVLLIIWCGK
jgi:hypothetical protein